MLMMGLPVLIMYLVCDAKLTQTEGGMFLNSGKPADEGIGSGFACLLHMIGIQFFMELMCSLLNKREVKIPVLFLNGLPCGSAMIAVIGMGMVVNAAGAII